MDGVCSIAIDDLFIALSVFDNLAKEEIRSNRTRTVSNCLGQLSLKAFGKGIIALTCDYCQYIYVMNIIAQCVGVHSLTILVNTKT